MIGDPKFEEAVQSIRKIFQSDFCKECGMPLDSDESGHYCQMHRLDMNGCCKDHCLIDEAESHCYHCNPNSTPLYCRRCGFPDDEPICMSCYSVDYIFRGDIFLERILNLLPQDWRRGFRADEALEVFTLDEYIHMTYSFTPKKNIDSIMKLCILNSSPDDRHGNSPYAILKMLHRKGFKLNGEMYELARSDECIDSEDILRLFCDEPVKKIQRAWLKYREWNRNRAVQIIQSKFREWLYRPGGPMMKKIEKHFNELSITHTN